MLGRYRNILNVWDDDLLNSHNYMVNKNKFALELPNFGVTC